MVKNSATIRFLRSVKIKFFVVKTIYAANEKKLICLMAVTIVAGIPLLHSHRAVFFFFHLKWHFYSSTCWLEILFYFFIIVDNIVIELKMAF